jgi:hypothetical protein
MREAEPHVGRSAQSGVVEEDQLTVAGQLHVDLHHVRVLLDG